VTPKFSLGEKKRNRGKKPPNLVRNSGKRGEDVTDYGTGGRKGRFFFEKKRSVLAADVGGKEKRGNNAKFSPSFTDWSS